MGVCPRGHLGRTIRGSFLGLRLLLLPSAFMHLSWPFRRGAMGNPAPTCALRMMAFESPHRKWSVLVGPDVSAQRCELMDQLPCCLTVMFLYGNPGHYFSGSATKIAADGIFGVLKLLRLYTWPKGSTKVFFLFARVPSSKLRGKAKRVGYCFPLVAQI